MPFIPPGDDEDEDPLFDPDFEELAEADDERCEHGVPLMEICDYCADDARAWINDDNHFEDEEG